MAHANHVMEAVIHVMEAQAPIVLVVVGVIFYIGMASAYLHVIAPFQVDQILLAVKHVLILAQPLNIYIGMSHARPNAAEN